MMNRMQEKIRSVWPLPGGNDQYLETLVQALQWLYQKEGITIQEELSAWFQREYHVGEKTVPGYIGVIKYLSAMDIDPKGMITITSFGKEIVNATNRSQQAGLVVHRFMDNYLAFPEVLAVYEKTKEVIHLNEMVDKLMPLFPTWTSRAQYEYRALWLLSLGCLEQDKGRYYQITEYGMSIASQYPSNIEIGRKSDGQVEPSASTSEGESADENKLNEIIEELKESARDTRNPNRFEAAIAAAFEMLGFKVYQLGETGDTDVLLSAEIGTESYRVIVDGKSRSSGKLNDLNSFVLEQHREKNKADFIVVVAEDFAGGNVESQASANKIVLLPIEVMCDWLTKHQETPFNLLVQKSMFEESGRVKNLSVSLKSVHDQRTRWAKLIIEVVQLVDENYTFNLLDPLSIDNLFIVLANRLRGIQYSERMVEQVVQLLSHDALGNIMKMDENGVTLQMNLVNASASLRALAEMLDSENELSE